MLGGSWKIARLRSERPSGSAAARLGNWPLVICLRTHDFLGKALEVWRLNSPEIIVDCIEMDSLSQERALLEGRISVGILVPSDRPVLELLKVRLLIKYPV